MVKWWDWEQERKIGSRWSESKRRWNLALLPLRVASTPTNLRQPIATKKRKSASSSNSSPLPPLPPLQLYPSYPSILQTD